MTAHEVLKQKIVHLEQKKKDIDELTEDIEHDREKLAAFELSVQEVEYKLK